MTDSYSFAKWWRLCALVSLAIVVLSIVPQLHFWGSRGSQWKGAYSILQGDEPLYSAYVAALMHGRPRRTDPAAGEDDNLKAPLPESLFSIQFLPAYAIAIPARILHLSPSNAFIALLVICAALASFAVFWLFMVVSNNRQLAAIGVLTVLCFGALAGGQGIIGLLLKPEVRFLGLPFLRRYEPAMAFPLSFIFCTLVWQSLRFPDKHSTLRPVLAGFAFGLLVFSYFYLWTAAAAWFVCAVGLWLTGRPSERRNTLRVLLLTSAPAAVALAVYAYFISRMPRALDQAQALTFTHHPDILRTPEIIALVIIGLVAFAIWRRQVPFAEPQVLFALSCAGLTFIVFNQQVITGRSIQPYHFEVLIANYLVLVGLVVIIRLLQPNIRRRAALLLVTLCLFWAAIEVSVPLHVRSAIDARNDEMVPVLRRLNQLAMTDGTWDGLRKNGSAPTLVFSSEYALSRLQPTWAPQGSLVGTGSASFQSLQQSTRKEWLYLQLYYSGKDGDYLRRLMTDRLDDLLFAFFAKSTTFGPERALLFLGWDAQRISEQEVDQEVLSYQEFVRVFSREEALKRPIAYAVVPADGSFNSTNLDRWYERDSGERVGNYVLYRVKLKN